MTSAEARFPDHWFETLASSPTVSSLPSLRAALS